MLEVTSIGQSSRERSHATAEDRYKREREFHDARFAAQSGRRADRFYAIDRASKAFYLSRLDAAPALASVLDYGCGAGAYSAIHAAKAGQRRVTAIDLSDVAIEHARANARHEGVEARIDFRVMNAEALDLPAKSFDLVCGNGVLHHLDMERALSEVSRVLASDGRAVFTEPLGHNPLINLYRARTPEQRSHDEHPLLLSDFLLAHQYFGEVHGAFFHLASLLALPFRNSRGFDGLLTRLEALDRAIFRRLPAAQRFAWITVLELERPTRGA